VHQQKAFEESKNSNDFSNLKRKIGSLLQKSSV